MARPSGATAEEARRRAQAQFDKAKKNDTDVWREREKLRQEDADKTSRLRALRLAKEAADKEAAAAPKEPKPASARRKPDAKKPIPSAED